MRPFLVAIHCTVANLTWELWGRGRDGVEDKTTVVVLAIPQVTSTPHRGHRHQLPTSTTSHDHVYIHHKHDNKVRGRRGKEYRQDATSGGAGSFLSAAADPPDLLGSCGTWLQVRQAQSAGIPRSSDRLSSCWWWSPRRNGLAGTWGLGKSATPSSGQPHSLFNERTGQATRHVHWRPHCLVVTGSRTYTAPWFITTAVFPDTTVGPIGSPDSIIVPTADVHALIAPTRFTTAPPLSTSV